MQRILRACLHSWNGVVAAARSEAAFRQELAALALGVLLAFLIADGAWKRMTLIGVLLFVLVVELINTAIEKLADRITLNSDPRIGAVKDMGSAAVGGALLIAGLVWLVAIWEWVTG